MLKNHHNSSFVISLDFELFWGVIRSRSIDDYKRNVINVKDVIPSILNVFNEYEIRATWAVVGGILCEDFNHWNDLIQSSYYESSIFDNNEIKATIQNNPHLFFSNDLVKIIINSPGQELASHTFGHYEVDNEVNFSQNFKKDMALNNMIMNEHHIVPTSLVFPRNIINKVLLDALPELGIKAFRGNQDHFIYRNGDIVPFGIFGKGLRYLDSSFNLSHLNPSKIVVTNEISNIPSSYFLRPIAGGDAKNRLNFLRLKRIKNQMLDAAKTESLFHLWWHPHNFGSDLNENIYFLKLILDYFLDLKSEYGMSSMNMQDLT
jgi:peptidoglycan/xylan/chitin deacetylase (PgdA/CDA1 family)